MDRMSDSGSDDMGSTPFEDTFKVMFTLISIKKSPASLFQA